ncbi:MAG: AMP-binding protein [Deltaproteobacteria bacterium]|nr:AMP-binding protein [Deltaproteobacteria bacterium]
MERIWMKSWPEGVPRKIQYRLGEKPLHEYLRQNARDFPDKPAFIFYGREITWKELDKDTDRFANFLWNAGIQKGDKIVLFMQNCPQYVIAHYGAQKLGVIVGPASPMFKEWELEYEVNDLGARIIVTSDDLYPIVKNIRANTCLEEVVLINYQEMASSNPLMPVPKELRLEKRSFPGTRDLMEVLRTHPPQALALDIDMREDVCTIVYTSGTTGRPKGAMLTYENTLFKIASTFQFNQMQPKDVRLTVLPLCHIAGNNQGLGLPVYGGFTNVLLTRFETEAVLVALERYHCTIWSGTTPMLLALMKHPDADKRNLSSLRQTFCTSFGVILTEEIGTAWKNLTRGSRVNESGYGLTETNTFDAIMPYDRVKYGSYGIPVFETDFKILDLQTGKELGLNKQGEIVVRNPGVFKGYWNNPKATAETLRNGWVHTGDIGRFDDDGYLYFLGRIKEMIKCSGYSVFPEDVEVMLLKHPAIEQVGVIGIPDPVRGESVKAFIVLKPEYKGKITEEEFISWAKKKIAAYKYPRAIEFRESLPATAAGKVLRRLLKQE